jgi:hypothetical protein
MMFYPRDWRSDMALRSVSSAARGLWIDMLGIMHEANPRGWLVLNDRPITPEALANLCSMRVDETVALLAELEAAGVFSRRRNGIICSRRMERDEAIAQKNYLNGKMGGNPALKSSSDLNGPRANGEQTESKWRDNGEKAASGTTGNKTEIRKSVKAPLIPRIQNPESRKDISDDISPPIVPQTQGAEEAVVRAWNSLAGEIGIASVQHLSVARRTKLKARLAEIGGMEGWFTACDEIRQSRFLRGDNDRGWRITFDWMLSPNNITKLMEGNYRDRKSSHTGNAAQRRFADEIADERERILSRAAALERGTDDHE